MTRCFRTGTLIFLGCWLFFMVIGRGRLFGDPGTFWHIVVGQRILIAGELIHTDPFSFTHAGEPWIAQWWLAECLLAVVHDGLGGLDSVFVVTATLLAWLFTWLALRLIRAGLHPVLAILIMALSLLASAYHLLPRPHLATIVFVAWTFAWLCDFEAGRISLARLFWLVPVFLVWTNMHGGMVGGLGMLAVALAGWTFAKLIGQESPFVRYGQVVTFGILVLLCALTALVNPYGLALPRVWFALMSSSLLPQLIQEHAPLLQAGNAGWAVLLVAVVYGAALAGTLPRWPRVTWLIPLIWLGLTWTRIRYGPLFAVTAAIALADMFPHIRWAQWLVRQGSEILQLRRPLERLGFDWRAALVPTLLVMTALVLQTAAIPFPLLGHGWVRLKPTDAPVELLPELRAHEMDRSDGTPIFNEMIFGGFLIYHTPGFSVFIDDRCELYGEAGLLAYANAAWHNPAQVDHWAEEYGFDLALTLNDSEFDRYLRGSRAWSVVRQGEAATLFRRHARSATQRP